jgi:hypothetical protein
MLSSYYLQGSQDFLLFNNKHFSYSTSHDFSENHRQSEERFCGSLSDPYPDAEDRIRTSGTVLDRDPLLQNISIFLFSA